MTGTKSRPCFAAGPIEPVMDGSANAIQRIGAMFQRRLAPHQFIEFLLELFLIEQLAAGGAVDLGAQFGDAIFVTELLLRLPCNQRAQHIVTERKIGGGRNRPSGHDHDGADRDPKGHRPESDLTSGVGDGVGAFGRFAGWTPASLGAVCAVARSVVRNMLRRLLCSRGLHGPRRFPLRH